MSNSYTKSTGPLNIEALIKDKSFEEIKYAVVGFPYYLSVAEDNDMFMLNFTSRSNLNEPICREANGVIFQKETNKLLHWSFGKTYNGIKVGNQSTTPTITGAEQDEKDYFAVDDIKGNKAIKDGKEYDVKMQIYTEGTLIKVFYHEEWKIATSHIINAAFCFWNNEKSFKELFYESGVNYENFDRDYCYSFILQHPENHITKKINVIFVKMLSKYHIETGQDFNECEGYIYSPGSTKTLEYFLSENNFNEDAIAYIGDKRVKILSRETLKIRENQKIKKETVVKYLKNWSRGEFSCQKEFDIVKNIDDLVKDEAILVYHQYRLKHIKKQDIDILKRHKNLIYNIHGCYLRDKTPITLEFTKSSLQVNKEFLSNLLPKLL